MANRREFMMGLASLAIGLKSGAGQLPPNLTERIVKAACRPENLSLARLIRLEYLAKAQSGRQVSITELTDPQAAMEATGEYVQEALGYTFKKVPTLALSTVSRLGEDLCGGEIAGYDISRQEIRVCSELCLEKFMCVYAHELVHHANMESKNMVSSVLEEGLARTITEAAIRAMEKDLAIEGLASWSDRLVYNDLLKFDNHVSEIKGSRGANAVLQIDPNTHAFGTTAIKIMQTRYGAGVPIRLFHKEYSDLQRFLGD